jgi:hypothetical protein
VNEASRDADAIANGIEREAQEYPLSSLRPKLFVLLLLAIPSLFLFSAIPIVRSQTFPIASGDPFLLNPDFAFSLTNVNCDVIIYGDSTALTGLDPTVISKVTGLKTCNISQAQSIVEILGMQALDTYLKNNSPPKFIVMQFAPETLSRSRADMFWPEGLTLLVRRRPLLEAFLTFLSHPVRAYQFSIWAIKAKVSSLVTSPPDFSATEDIFRSRGGLLMLPKPPETRCINEIAYTPPAVQWVRDLKDKYALNSTQVLVNVAPLPTCSPIADLVAKGTRNVTDNSLSLFPISLFSDMDRHLNLEGAERASLELAKQLTAASDASAEKP